MAIFSADVGLLVAGLRYVFTRSFARALSFVLCEEFGWGSAVNVAL